MALSTSPAAPDYIDIVKDSVTGGDYKKEEDPKLFVSTKTGRGPLTDNWRSEYGQAMRAEGAGDKEVMTAYKLCRVEFKYWGMQNKIERFIHDVGEYRFGSCHSTALYLYWVQGGVWYLSVPIIFAVFPISKYTSSSSSSSIIVSGV